MSSRLWIAAGAVALGLVLIGCGDSETPAAPASVASTAGPSSEEAELVDHESFEGELARIEQEAYQRGYEEGHANGRNEGFYEGLRAAEEGGYPSGPFGSDGERPWWVDVKIPSQSKSDG